MNIEAETVTAGQEQGATPSADFIHAISQFLDTNPHDLLVELGYYSRDGVAAEGLPAREK